MLLKRAAEWDEVLAAWPFSTLYRVDAIEALEVLRGATLYDLFQYPLSGRCY